MKRIKINKIHPNAKTPSRGSSLSAGYDLYAAIDEPIEIPPQGCAKIGTGLQMELPDNIFGAIFARSGLATKQGGRPANCVGVIDPDYRGEYIVAMYNDNPALPLVICPGDKIAQLVFLPFYTAQFIECDTLSQTKRGDGGFGSTGV